VQEQYEKYRTGHIEASKDEVHVARGRGAVASVSREATQFAIDVLKDGGNAFDAAFALAFALAVCHPQAGNLGGGGYIVIKEKKAREPQVFNYREQSPAGAEKKCYLTDDGTADPDKTAFGPSSVCVPGTVQAFFLLQERYGVLECRDLLKSLAGLARAGCRISAYQAQCLNRLAQKLSFSPESKKLYVRDREVFRKDDILTNSNLANTFEILAREGMDAFYRGRIADRIEDDLTRNGGVLTVRDLKNYEIREVRPIQTELRDCTVWTVPPEGGGAILVEIINILNKQDFLKIKPFTPDYYHYIAQAAKIAFIDRMAYMGDGDWDDTMVYRAIFDARSTDERFTLIDAGRDKPTMEYAAKLHGEGCEELSISEAGQETTHFSVVDAEGNAVSNSYTLNLRYGSKWAIEGTGMLMNGSMDSFAFVPGKPNYFGVMGNRMNLFEPNKRPASNMAPVLVTKKGEIQMLIGSPGGPTIPTSLASILFAVLVHDIDPAVSIGEGRVHHQAWPDVLYGEQDAALFDKLVHLEAKGYIIEERGEPIGDMHAVFKKREQCMGISDYRREGFAAVY